MVERERHLAHIQQAVLARRYRFTIHGAQQRIARVVSEDELEDAIIGGEVIEDYPFHRYGPACLVLGSTAAGRALHVVCSLNQTIDIITVYEPDPNEWEEDLRTRRTR